MYKEEKKKIAKEILKDFEEHYKQLLLTCYTPWQTALKSFKDKYGIEPWVNER